MVTFKRWKLLSVNYRLIFNLATKCIIPIISAIDIFPSTCRCIRPAWLSKNLEITWLQLPLFVIPQKDYLWKGVLEVYEQLLIPKFRQFLNTGFLLSRQLDLRNSLICFIVHEFIYCLMVLKFIILNISMSRIFRWKDIIDISYI